MKQMEKMKSSLPSDLRRTLDKHAEVGDYDNLEYQKALRVYFKKYGCRLAIVPTNFSTVSITPVNLYTKRCVDQMTLS